MRNTLLSTKKQDAKPVKTIAYLRVSTTGQDVEKNKSDIKAWVKQKGLGKIDWVTEKVSVWGDKNWHRRELGNVIDKKLTTGDWLITPEFSRLARSTRQVLDILAECKRKGISVYVVKGNQVVNGSIESKVFVTMMSLFAEIESDLISARTMEGLRASRAAGVIPGRHRGTSKLDPVKDEIIAALKNGESKLSIGRRFKTTMPNLYGWLKRRGINHKQSVEV